MRKIVWLTLLSLAIMVAPSFANQFSPEIKAPKNVILSDISDEAVNGNTYTNFNLQVNFSVDEMINHMLYDYEDKGEEEFWSSYGVSSDGSSYKFKNQIDWKIDNGEWISEQTGAIPSWNNCESVKDNANCQWEYCDIDNYDSEIAQYQDIFNLGYEGDYNWYDESDPDWGWKNVLPSDIFYWVTDSDGNRHPYIDLKNHSVTVRVRTVCQFSTEYGDYEYKISDWSKEASIGGKAGEGAVRPTTLSKPVISGLTVERVNNPGGGNHNQPYLMFNMIVPEDVTTSVVIAEALNEQMSFRSEVSINGGAYVQLHNLYAQGLGRFELNDGKYEQYFDTEWITQNGHTVESLQAGKIDYRIRYEYCDNIAPVVVSDWATISIGRDAWSNASVWATSNLQKANELGLIPDTLKGQDMTADITRQEFAAVSVKVYEALSGAKAIPNVVNPFTDTVDVEVLKAYNVGITSGTAADKFSPNVLLNREQAAAMLTRVFKKVSMNGWTLATDTDPKFNLDTTGAVKFTDDAKISDWAKQSVYFMVKNKIINGMGDGTFAPKNVTTEEQANGYANATREQALTIAVKMVENLK